MISLTINAKIIIIDIQNVSIKKWKFTKIRKAWLQNDTTKENVWNTRGFSSLRRSLGNAGEKFRDEGFARGDLRARDAFYILQGWHRPINQARATIKPWCSRRRSISRRRLLGVSLLEFQTCAQASRQNARRSLFHLPPLLFLLFFYLSFSIWDGQWNT